MRSSAEGIVSAKAAQLPSIGASASIGGSWSQPQGGDFSTSASSSIGVNFSQTLFDSGRSDAGIDQARTSVQLAKYALRNAEQNVLLSVVQAYFAVIRDTQLVQLRADNMAFFEAQVTSSEDRLRLGEGTRIDVSQAKARQAAAISSYRAAVASLQTSQASYQRWVGHKPANLTGEFNFGNMLPTSIESTIAYAEDNHPALLSARAAIRIAQSGVDAAEGAFGPTLALSAGIDGSTSWSDVGTSVSNVGGSARLSLSIPIYSGGALGAGLRKANIEQIKSEVDALSARDSIRESVISAFSSLQNATAQIDSATASVESTQLVVEGTIQERDVGQKTTLDVLNAQAELTSAREGLISARAARMIAAFSLLAASGKLNPETLGLNVAVHSADGYINTVEGVWQELRTLDE